jgi:hypothetical protein
MDEDIPLPFGLLAAERKGAQGQVLGLRTLMIAFNGSTSPGRKVGSEPFPPICRPWPHKLRRAR